MFNDELNTLNKIILLLSDNLIYMYLSLSVSVLVYNGQKLKKGVFNVYCTKGDQINVLLISHNMCSCGDQKLNIYSTDVRFQSRTTRYILFPYLL